MNRAATDTKEQNDEGSARLSPDIIEERIKANLEPLHTQIFALTEMMDRFFQGNSAREFTTASTHEARPRPESPFAEAPRTSRFPPVVPFTAAGHSLCIVLLEDTSTENELTYVTRVISW